MRQGWLELQEGAGRRSLGDGVHGGNDVDGVGGWGGAEGSGSPLGGDVYVHEHEDGDGDGGVPLQQQNPCVTVGVRSRTESGGVEPDLFQDSPKVVH